MPNKTLSWNLRVYTHFWQTLITTIHSVKTQNYTYIHRYVCVKYANVCCFITKNNVVSIVINTIKRIIIALINREIVLKI